MVDAEPMSVLASRWSELLIGDLETDEHLTAAAAATGSLLRQAATETEIREAEERLGCRLPASYRDFLLFSNGAYADDYGPTIVCDPEDAEEAPLESSVVGVGFLPVQDVTWLRDAMPWFAEMLSEPVAGSEPGPVTEDGQHPWPWAPFADGLLIATDKHPGTTVLIRFDGLDEWQMWNVHKESSTAYRSFRSFLEGQVREREPVNTLPEVEELLERGRAGDQEATMRLSRVRTAEAFDLLSTAVDDPQIGQQVVRALACLGTPEAVGLVMGMDAERARPGLIALGTQEARDLLFTRNDMEGLRDTGDPRAVDLAAAAVGALDPTQKIPWDMRGAFFQVSHTGDPRYLPLLMQFFEHGPEGSFDLIVCLANLGAPEGLDRLEAIAVSASDSRNHTARHLLRQARKRLEKG
ncbi:hypothetical protein GCM10022223_55850 [Kineosporia mesophila]|uniref:Knr4/Smi1-like domain-containing protein n=1 Tax=Kineosporia mesophila TaxID=566012 RepID=A0ABP7AF29_9ACTN|nr:SMI1/KNR4 family protein [Kineosporia mesophila]MCD5352886.1 SMI1/KNR4 family protein [Kineosporia mesophila]